MTASAM